MSVGWRAVDGPFEDATPLCRSAQNATWASSPPSDPELPIPRIFGEQSMAAGPAISPPITRAQTRSCPHDFGPFRVRQNDDIRSISELPDASVARQGDGPMSSSTESVFTK